MNKCLNCGRQTSMCLKYCNRLCRCSYHSRKHSRKLGTLSKEDALAALGKLSCKYIACGTLFIPETFGQIYCSKLCRDKEALLIRPSKTFEQKLRWNHKLTIKEYQEMVEKGCAVCSEAFDMDNRNLIPCIDHNHACCKVGKSCTKCRRGLIHSKCNLILGHADDNPRLLRQAAQYLEVYEKAQVQTL